MANNYINSPKKEEPIAAHKITIDESFDEIKIQKRNKKIRVALYITVSLFILVVGWIILFEKEFIRSLLTNKN